MSFDESFALFIGGALLPLRTPEALLMALAGALLAATATVVPVRRVAIMVAAIVLGASLGIALPTLSGAGTLTVLALGGATLVSALAILAPAWPIAPVAIIVLLANALAGQVAFARFFAGELPPIVTAAAIASLTILGSVPMSCLALSGERRWREPLRFCLRVLASWQLAVTVLMLALRASGR